MVAQTSAVLQGIVFGWREGKHTDDHLMSITGNFHDVRLKKQMSWLCEMNSLQKATGVLGTSWGAAASREDRRFTEEWAYMCKPVKQSLLILHGMLQNNKQILETLFQPCDKSLKVLVVAAESIDFGTSPASFTDDLVTEAGGIINSIEESWRSDMDALCKMVDSFCPGWQHLVDSDSDDLLKPEFVKSMTENPHYPNLSAIANIIDSALVADKVFAKFGPNSSLFDKAAAKRAQECRDHAYNTVSLTYALHHVFTKLPLLKKPKEIGVAVEELRSKLQLKGFKLPAACERRIAVLLKHGAPTA
jgi:hypothetical protein